MRERPRRSRVCRCIGGQQREGFREARPISTDARKPGLELRFGARASSFGRGTRQRQDRSHDVVHLNELVLNGKRVSIRVHHLRQAPQRDVDGVGGGPRVAEQLLGSRVGGAVLPGAGHVR